MAMLAEKRSKQKWSEDPRNIHWSNDKDRYGYQMLEKMGWSNGKGLGRKRHGSTSHVKIKKRKQNLGLGAKETHDKDWIAHQEDFNNLLSALQQHGGNAELRSEEQNKRAMLEVAKASKKRVFYKKFIRSKDTSHYSEKDMACIFGTTPSPSAPATPQNQSDDDAQSDDSSKSCPTSAANSSNECGFVTYTSKQNIQEYFARRMKELKEGKGIEKNNEDEVEHQADRQEVDDDTSCEEKNIKKAKKKKKLIDAVEKCALKDSLKRKKKKKRTKNKEINGGHDDGCLANGQNRTDINGEDFLKEFGGFSKDEVEVRRKKGKKKKKPRKDLKG